MFFNVYSLNIFIKPYHYIDFNFIQRSGPKCKIYGCNSYLKLKDQNPICYFTERGILFTKLLVY